MKNLHKFTYLGKEVSIDDFEDSSITYEMLSNMTMNSYVRTSIYPKLTKEALVQVSKDILKQCTPIPSVPVTYDESVIKNVFPELLERVSSDTDDSFKEIKKLNLQDIGKVTLPPEDLESFESIHLNSKDNVNLPDKEEALSFEENLSLRSQISELSIDLANDIEDGEIFYDLELFETYKKNLKQLNELSTKYFHSNK